MSESLASGGIIGATRPPVIALLGPTASGKTAAALALARRFPVEIVSVDSALVYRGMDIGTAKPTPDERALVPHHLIDLIEPTSAYSAMDFRNAALKLVGDIFDRGRWPLLVGGTMLYYKALAEGLNDLPAADPSIRAELDREATKLGVPALHARLAALDPVTAARLKPNDAQRIQRALEIFWLTGKPMSALLTGRSAATLPFALWPIALEPGERSVLHQRIADRFDAMLAAPDGGLVGEVEQLRARGDLHPGLPSMRCVGYRQAWEHLDGDYGLAELRERGVAATRQLAKRQLTWLRSMPDRLIVDCVVSSSTANVVEQAGRIWKDDGPS